MKYRITKLVLGCKSFLSCREGDNSVKAPPFRLSSFPIYIQYEPKPA